MRYDDSTLTLPTAAEQREIDARLAATTREREQYRDATRPSAPCTEHGQVHGRGSAADRRRLWAKMTALHGTACSYCGRDDEKCERDRIVAACYYVLPNVIPACSTCNEARSDMSMAAWLQDPRVSTPRVAAERIRVAATASARKPAADRFWSELAAVVAAL